METPAINPNVEIRLYPAKLSKAALTEIARKAKSQRRNGPRFCAWMESMVQDESRRRKMSPPGPKELPRIDLLDWMPSELAGALRVMAVFGRCPFVDAVAAAFMNEVSLIVCVQSAIQLDNFQALFDGKTLSVPSFLSNVVQ